MIGTTLGPYRIEAKLGEGGMGQVYRARDTRLDRDIALKVLPAGFSSDPDRVRRFEQEARAVAALSDAHIVAVYDVGQDGGVLYYAAELVEGSDLRALLDADRLPVRKALDLAAQIAAGLAAAHARGIVHRDLKPENVLVSKSGRAKIADFGLAKIAQPALDARGSSLAAPTATAAGVVLGTVAYMSPEQAAGRSLDYRSDQFGFGSMLYEMLAGRPAFRRDTAPETMTAILRDEPPSVIEANPSVPAPLVWILERCLAKAPEDRYGSTEDLAKDLERVKARSSELSGGMPARARTRSRLTAAVPVIVAVASLALAAYAFLTKRAPQIASTVLRTNIDLPEGVELAPFEESLGATLALSPDGGSVVVVGRKDGVTQLYLRPLNRPDPQLIPGTEGARGPFFSPDGQSIAFWADGYLKRLPLAGGGATVICDATTENGASWTSDDVILFSTGLGLRQVPADGGQPQTLTTPDAAKNEYAHTWPVAVPGTKTVLFSIKGGGEGPLAGSVGLLSLDTRRWTTIAPGASQPRFVAPGFVLVNRSGTLLAAPFDPTRLTAGSFTAIEEHVSQAGPQQIESFDVTPSGRGLVFLASRHARQDRAVYAVDLHGKADLLSDARRAYWSPALSPDGGKLAVNVWINPQVSEIWVLDLARRTWQRLTAGNNDWEPVWKGPGTLIYARGQGGSAAWDEYSLPASGMGAPTLLARFPHQIESHAVASDRRSVVFTTHGTSSFDMWTQPIDLQSAARPLLVTPADEQTLSPSFSPDGRWLAYTSNTTGRTEVYVMDYPAATARYSVSTLGGEVPSWSRDGHQIFYRHGQTMMAANVRPGSTFAIDPPRALFTTSLVPFLEFDVSSDGSRFYMIGSETSPGAASIVFVSDLADDLRSLSPR